MQPNRVKGNRNASVVLEGGNDHHRAIQNTSKRANPSVLSTTSQQFQDISTPNQHKRVSKGQTETIDTQQERKSSNTTNANQFFIPTVRKYWKKSPSTLDNVPIAVSISDQQLAKINTMLQSNAVRERFSAISVQSPRRSAKKYEVQRSQRKAKIENKSTTMLALDSAKATRNKPLLSTSNMEFDSNTFEGFDFDDEMDSQDDSIIDPNEMLMQITPIGKLKLLRDVMNEYSDSNGFIDRDTLNNTFELNNINYESTRGNKMNGDNRILAKSILIDAALALDVEVENKLRFIFDTLDTKQIGSVTSTQLADLMISNFMTAHLEIKGANANEISQLIFQKAGVSEEKGMSFDIFKRVFSSYFQQNQQINTSEQSMKSVNEECVVQEPPLSKFHQWYASNYLRFWWIIGYIIINNIAFWVKWHMYKVDPALGYGLRIARACAQVIMLNGFLLMLPMCRSITQVLKRSNTLWRYIPFDDHIEFHKLCGTVLLSAGVIHMVAHTSNFIHLYLIASRHEIKHSIFVEREVDGFMDHIGHPPPFTSVMFTLPIWTGAFLLVITCISFPIAAIPKFRQGNFNLFWYSHMIFGPFLLILCIHGGSSWLATSTAYLWILPLFMIYLIERRYRYAKVFVSPVRIMKAEVLDGALALYLEKPRRFDYKPGMYTFICCPKLSSHEWHPFTISSAPGDNYVGLHIRNAGDWTNAMHELIKDCHKNKLKYPDVYLDGPVGAPTQDYHRFSTVMIIAGGIGVTPMASILKDVVHLWEDYRCLNCSQVKHPRHFKLRKIYFHWITREQESLGWFKETMNQISDLDTDSIIETHQYLSTVKSSENTTQLRMFQEFIYKETGKDVVSGLQSKILTHFGRPDWDNIFQSMKQKHRAEDVGVFFCGPLALDTILQQTCQKYSSHKEGGTTFDYHSEKFT